MDLDVKLVLLICLTQRNYDLKTIDKFFKKSALTFRVFYVQASSCNMCNVTMDEKEIVLEPGNHTIRVNVDTKDGKYHNNAYFRITFAVKKKDVCKSCKCPGI